MKEMNSLNFEDEVLRSAEPVLVDFYTADCGPCKNVSFILDEIGQERAGRLKIVKLNAGEENVLAAQYGVHQVPNLLLFKKGEVVAQRVGNAAKAILLRWLDELIGH